MKKTIKIKPRDPLFFRTGKPFEMGEESWTASMPLPNPSVIWGALFTHYIKSKGITDPEEINVLTDRFSIDNVFLYDESDYSFYLPAPYDIFKDDKDFVLYKYKMRPEDFISSEQTDFLIFPDTVSPGAKHLNNYLIEVSTIPNYFRLQKNQVRIEHISDFLKNYPKVGIARNKSRTTKEGHLYAIDMSEFNENISFIVEIELDESINFNDFIKLGADGKIAEITEKEEVPELKHEERDDYDLIKILFTSHTFIQASIDDLKNIGLLAMSIGKLQYVGGWDMQKQQPKPMMQVLPAGSVMLFDASKWEEVDFISKLQYNISGYPTTVDKLGFNKFITFKY